MVVPRVTFACLVMIGALTASTGAQSVVQSKGPGAWGAQLRLVEEVRIGELEGAPEYTFGAIISHLTVGNDGAIFVGEGGRPALLRMYDGNGRFVRKIGGDGEGPGEYRSILGLATMRDGNIALRDNQIGRISIYDARGEFLTSHRLPSGYYSADVFRVDTAGNFYVKVPRDPGRPSGNTLDRPMVWIKVSSTGQVLDSIPIPIGTTQGVQTYGGPGKSRLDQVVASLSPFGYFVTGTPGPYTFGIQRQGQPVLRVQREHTPVRLSRAEKAEWEAMADYMSKRPIFQTNTRGPDGKLLTIDGPTTKYVATTRGP